MAAEKRVTILMTAEEFADVKKRAGIASVSAYIKSVLFRTVKMSAPLPDPEKWSSVKISEGEVGNEEIPVQAIQHVRDSVPPEPERTGYVEKAASSHRPMAQRVGRGHRPGGAGQRGKSAKEEKKGKCEAPVGPGIYCPGCGKRH